MTMYLIIIIVIVYLCRAGIISFKRHGGRTSGNSRMLGDGRESGNGGTSSDSGTSGNSKTPGSGTSRKPLRDDIKRLLNMPAKTQQHTDVCAAAKVKKYGINALGIEDRENDWLARQLREEAEIKKRMYSDMAALKQEHIAEHGKIHRGSDGVMDEK